jgi:pimeloyl-ACP methyl ester carboxylesterase
MRRRVEVAGRTITYLEGGATVPVGASERVRTLLLLHAFPFSAAMWRPQLWSAPSGWRFVAPDFRGFGPDAAGEEANNPTIDDFAADALDLLNALSIDNVVVAGLSMGGYVAFALLQRAPERVAGLMLADTRATADSPEGRAGRLAMIERLDQYGVAAVVDEMMPKLLGPTTRAQQPSLAGSLRRLMLENSAKTVRAAILRLMARPDRTPWLSEVTCPTLIIVGQEDTLTPVGESRYMQERIDGARLSIVPSAGHMSNVEQPLAFNQEMNAFLALHF